MRPQTAIVWFRRDLRVHDHPALQAALARADRVVPLFVLDENLLSGRWPSPNRVAFMLDSLRVLDEQFRERGSSLVVRRGKPADVVAEIAAETGASDVHVSREYGPYGRRRDEHVRRALADLGIRFSAHPGTLIQEPEAVLTKESAPYSVFSPFRRTWESLPVRRVLPAPVSLPAHGILPGAIPSIMRLEVGAPSAAGLDAGESAARQRLAAWLRGSSLAAYKARRDRVDLDATSRLSQDLRWGLLSPVEVLSRCTGDSDGHAAYIAELCWREFYAHVLWHSPRVVNEPYQGQFASLPWENDPGKLAAWQEGRTGYPIVDAAMRQLRATGWMHNRARMIVASFLTKDLLVDWRFGESWFMRELIDGDVASNNGGWQWAASTGTNPQPYFRIFNPVLQGQRFDPDGDFVRRWVPELAHVESRHVHQPWMMPLDAQAAARCVIGVDYPAPIVNHAAARASVLEMYTSVQETALRA
jgi:deoxyribodipyrimidine photo-lyase